MAGAGTLWIAPTDVFSRLIVTKHLPKCLVLFAEFPSFSNQERSGTTASIPISSAESSKLLLAKPSTHFSNKNSSLLSACLTLVFTFLLKKLNASPTSTRPKVFSSQPRNLERLPHFSKNPRTCLAVVGSSLRSTTTRAFFR